MSVSETEKIIKEKLEASGQLAKMRAMVVEASLQALSGNSAHAAELFAPSPALQQLKASEDGSSILSLVLDFLECTGLEYTASVLKTEASVGEATILDRNALVAKFGVEPMKSATLSVLSQVALKAENGTGSAAGVGGASAASAGSAASPPLQSGAAVSTLAPAPSASLASAPAKQVQPAEDSNDDDDDDSDDANDDDGDDDDDDDDDVSAGNKSEETSDDESNDEGGSAAAAAAATAAPEQKGTDTTYEIGKWKGKTFYRENQVAGQQLQLEELTDCTVYILDPLDSLMVDYCEGGKLIVAACEGSVFLRNCKNVTVTVACKQLRMRDCEHMEIRLFASTDPVVESSHHITFKPFNARLPKLKSSFGAARLDPKMNRFVHVYDFTTDTTTIPAPHFTVVFPNHGLAMEDLCAERGKPECPPEIEQLVALELMPAPSSETGVNKSYDIKKGAAIWNATANDGPSPTPDGPQKTLAPVPLANRANAVGGSAGLGALPPRPAAVPAAVQKPQVAGGGDDSDQSYSSFDDDEDSSDDEDEHMDVDEDEDDF